MQPVDRRKREFEETKKKKMEYIIDKALEIFCSQGIDNTKVTDIAKAADVGVASVYRYFKTKSDIAIQVGIKFWNQVKEEFKIKSINSDFINKNGLEEFKEIMNFFLILYIEYPYLLKFLHDLDAFIIKEKIESDKLKDYEKNILDIRDMVVNYIEKGQKDGSIKTTFIAEELYVTTTHTLMSLVQKLSLRGSILKSDINISGEQQIRMVLDMIITYVENK